MSQFLTFVLIGLASGSVYAIAGMGLVLTFKTSGIFNFAHGTQGALAAYLMYTFRDQQGLPWPVAALLALLLAGVVGGLLLERMAYALSGESTATRVAATVGLLVGLQSALVTVYGGTVLQPMPWLPQGNVRLFDVNVTYTQVISMVLAAAAAVALYLLFRRSRLGTSMQAVVDDPNLLALRGTSPVRVRRSAWTIGSLFASLSGLLLATFVGVDAQLLTLLVVFSFGAAAIGAFDSLPLTYAGGLLVGVGQSLSQRYLSQTSFLENLPANFPFVVLVIALLVIPTKRLVERGNRAIRIPTSPPSFRPLVARGGMGLGLLALLAVPVVFDTKLTEWTNGLAFVVVFASLYLLIQMSGQVSLCQIAFAAIGSTTMALATSVGVPWPVALLLGGLAAVPVGLLVALPAIRLRGVYLAIITLGFGLVLQRMVYGTAFMFGGFNQRSAPRPSFGPLDPTNQAHYYYVALGVAALMVAFVVRVRRGRLGRLLRGLAESPAMLAAHGSDVSYTKLYAFAVSAFVAGIGGGLIGPVTGTTAPTQFDFSVSLFLVAVLFIAGRQPVVAPFLAAILYAVGPAYIDSPQARDLFGIGFGVAALLVATRVVPRILDLLQTRQRPSERGAARRTEAPLPAGRIPATGAEAA